MIERLSRVLGTEVRRLTRVRSSGYTVAYHGIAELADGTTAFLKAATEPVTAQFIRDEQRVLGALDGPHVRAFQLAQLRVALPWAVRELRLEPPR